MEITPFKTWCNSLSWLFYVWLITPFKCQTSFFLSWLTSRQTQKKACPPLCLWQSVGCSIHENFCILRNSYPTPIHSHLCFHFLTWLQPILDPLRYFPLLRKSHDVSDKFFIAFWCVSLLLVLISDLLIKRGSIPSFHGDNRATHFYWEFQNKN